MPDQTCGTGHAASNRARARSPQVNRCFLSGRPRVESLPSGSANLQSQPEVSTRTTEPEADRSGQDPHRVAYADSQASSLRWPHM